MEGSARNRVSGQNTAPTGVHTSAIPALHVVEALVEEEVPTVSIPRQQQTQWEERRLCDAKLLMGRQTGNVEFMLRKEKR